MKELIDEILKVDTKSGATIFRRAFCLSSDHLLMDTLTGRACIAEATWGSVCSDMQPISLTVGRTAEPGKLAGVGIQLTPQSNHSMVWTKRRGTLDHMAVGHILTNLRSPYERIRSLTKAWNLDDSTKMGRQ